MKNDIYKETEERTMLYEQVYHSCVALRDKFEKNCELHKQVKAPLLAELNRDFRVQKVYLELISDERPLACPVAFIQW